MVSFLQTWPEDRKATIGALIITYTLKGSYKGSIRVTIRAAIKVLV